MVYNGIAMGKREAIVRYLKQHGRVTSASIAEQFGVSRQYVNVLLAQQITDGHFFKIGKTRYAYYVSRAYADAHPEVIPHAFTKRYRNTNLEEHHALLEIEAALPSFQHLPENVRSIFTFAFSEMLNNAIEHSQSKYVSVEVTISHDAVAFIVNDHGIGVFRNVMQKRGLSSEIAAVQDLLKGKTTTMPKSHSGEGIFFTSKAGDIFILESFGRVLSIDNQVDAVNTHRVGSSKRGTRVIFRVGMDANRHLNDVFKRYTNVSSEHDYGFDRTEIRVRLYTAGGVHISRSQARRILEGLEKFKVVLFDYDQVPLVGQAFADEIYRVFHHRHPEIQLENEHMSPGVRFMVERSQHEAERRE